MLPAAMSDDAGCVVMTGPTTTDAEVELILPALLVTLTQ
jgi:hypothetical protein